MMALAFTTPADASKWKRRLLYSPLARILLFIIVTLALLAITWGVVTLLGWTVKDAPKPQARASVMLRQILPTVGAYLFLVWFIERRAADELVTRTLASDVAKGIAAGAVFIGSVMGVIWLAGGYRVTGFNPDAAWVGALMIGGIGAGVAEEIVFRGVLFRIVEEGLGTWAALAVSALFFGASHIGNPGATLWSSFAIAVEAGILLGLLFQVTRSLPLCMGMHMAWNFIQGTVFGSQVSGTKRTESWLVGEFSGPSWLTGGGFGIEASVAAVAVSLLASAALLALARRRGTLVGWRPGRAPAASAAPADNGSISQGTTAC